jgi:hypothetical protein
MVSACGACCILAAVSADITPPDDTYFNRLWGLHNTGQNVNGINGTHDANIDALEKYYAT